MNAVLTPAERALAAHIKLNGPIPAARCSSAQARGAAKKYSYWGAARYEIRLTAAGYPSAVAVRGAGSDRRSRRLAEIDAAELADRIGGIEITHIGRCAAAAEWILVHVAPAWAEVRKARENARRACQRSLQERLHAYRTQRLCDLGVELRVERLKFECGPAAVENRNGMLVIRYTDADRPRAVTRPETPHRLIRIGQWDYDIHLAPQYYVPHGDHRDADAFRRESNVERRRMIWEACGVAIAEALDLTDGQVLQRDDYGTLYRAKLDYYYTITLLKVVNATPEPDGSYKVYWLRVPGDMRTAHQAVAWTFGLTAEQYHPAQQS